MELLKKNLRAASLGDCWTIWTTGSKACGCTGSLLDATGLPVGTLPVSALPFGTLSKVFLVNWGLSAFLGLPGFWLSDMDPLTGFWATGGPFLRTRGLPVSLLGETLEDVGLSEAGGLPGSACFLATTSDTFPLVLFNMATACKQMCRQKRLTWTANTHYMCTPTWRYTRKHFHHNLTQGVRWNTFLHFSPVLNRPLGVRNLVLYTPDLFIFPSHSAFQDSF